MKIGIRMVLALMFTLVILVSPGFAQSLDDVIDQSSNKQGVYTVPNQTGQPGEKKIFSDDSLITKDFITGFPLGFPELDRFIGFLDTLLKKILAKFKEQKQDQEPSDNTPTPISTGEPPPGKKSGSGFPKHSPGAPPGDESEPLPGRSAEDGGGIFPVRPSGSETGSEFLARTENMNPVQREQEILKSILSGNVPEFLRSFRDVTVRMKLSDGKEHSVTYKVLPDYLAIGLNSDFVRIPMSPIAAQTIATKFGCILPTTKMVDDIYKKASTQLSPQPMSGGKYPNWQARMTKNEFYREHHRLVEGQRNRTGHRFGDLIAGHKKDVVISNFLNTHPKNVVIYGWHDRNNGGKPIQGYGWGHENTYADYSHGIRLIGGTVNIDGRETAVSEVLGDKLLSRLLSNEGPMKDLRATR